MNRTTPCWTDSFPAVENRRQVATGLALVGKRTPAGKPAPSGRRDRDVARLLLLVLGGRIAASPMTYLSKGRQHVAIASGSGLFVLALPPEPSARSATEP